MGTPTGGPSPVTSDAIVGRRRELRQLLAWLEAARAGTGRLVLCGGEPGIGKTRLAQELAGAALAGGTAVAWGRCAETTGAPAFWPWRQVLRSLGVDPDSILGGSAETAEDRFRVFDQIARVVCDGHEIGAIVVILDDVHWSDESSLLALRHLVGRLDTSAVLVLATFRDVATASDRSPAFVDLLHTSGIERLDLHGFTAAEVGEQLSLLIPADTSPPADEVCDMTGGNPLFVREVARAVADGTWRPDRPPRSVLDVVSSRLGRASLECQRFVQAAAIAGRDFSLPVVAAALDEAEGRCLPHVDEAIALGLLDRANEAGIYRFVHALTRDAVEASLPSSDRLALHRAVAEALATLFAADLSEHLADIARHWAGLAPYGESASARMWSIRAADDAMRRLAYEEGAQLYRQALGLDPRGLAGADRCRVLLALGRAAHLAGDLGTRTEAATTAAGIAREAKMPELIAESALVLEATTDINANATAKQLCDEALSVLGDGERDGLKSRLLAQRSHLAFYDGEQDRVESLSAAALDLARSSGDDRALVDALHARKEACPGPTGVAERERIATEMLAVAERSGSARSAMWGSVWRIDALVEHGRIADAADQLPVLRAATDRLGGPVSAWYLGRITAFIAQAQGRYADSSAAASAALERMQTVERVPATGAYFALHCALGHHVRLPDEAIAFAMRPFDGPARFRTMQRISRSFLQLRGGATETAVDTYRELGPIDAWSLPVFFRLVAYVYGVLVAIELDRKDDVANLLTRLEQSRGEHIVGEGVAYLGPGELTLGRAAAALGRLDQAVDDLETAATVASDAGAPGFAAEASYHLATSLVARGAEGDLARAQRAARDAERGIVRLGMTAYTDRVASLIARLEGSQDRPAHGLSRREDEVARLVAEGLTNREIAERLFISERTAQNHVQHILTKLGFTRRSQIAAWRTQHESE